MQQLTFNAFMFSSLQEVEHERLFHFELMKNEMINLTVSRLAAMITNFWSDEAITAIAPIIEPLVEIAGLTDVKNLIMGSEEVDSGNIKRGNVEAAERAKTEAM